MDRSMNSPDLALNTLLTSLSQRVLTLERRIRWPGATCFTENLDPVSVPATDWVTVLALDLDPGRWMIYAATTLSASAGELSEIQIRDGSSLPAGSTGEYATGFTIISSLELPRSGGAAVLEARTASGTRTATQSLIIAVPT